ncbi:hypothetical protein OPV22_026314 [Ensete ventricosum]|uniref:Uncharacterized protein n=1 Tax=Ensete ventricosum TaxID=4639 RepID=A0AAV8PAL4_ENSVE|nr:hypothetical protein OPV22_026314 [Ensete ventricosum]
MALLLRDTVLYRRGSDLGSGGSVNTKALVFPTMEVNWGAQWASKVTLPTRIAKRQRKPQLQWASFGLLISAGFGGRRKRCHSPR